MMTQTKVVLLDDFASQVHAYLTMTAGRAVDTRNLKTTIDALGAGDRAIPVTVNHAEEDNCWVCSPHTAYVRYSREELSRLAHPVVAAPLSGLCRVLGNYLWRSGIDKAVAINNWTLSTNLYPALNKKHVHDWITESQQRWPQHAIWFRSLNERYTPDWLAQLKVLGCSLIPSRQVYLYDRVNSQLRMPANLRRDLKQLRIRLHEVSPADSWSTPDYQRAAALYEMLYLQKYSMLNPFYGAQFLRSWHAAGLLDLFGWRNEVGELEAVIGIFGAGATLTAPIVGYDTSTAPSRGLYRLLMAAVYDLADRTGQRINLSAGAADFKRLRGGIATIEYSAVYTQHLARSRRRPIRLLARLSSALGKPLMRRFQW